MIKILYFARFRDTLGRGEETLALPDNITTVKELINSLSERGPQWAETLNAATTLIALNQEIIRADAKLAHGDEVAFFPPVTGG